MSDSNNPCVLLFEKFSNILFYTKVKKDKYFDDHVEIELLPLLDPKILKIHYWYSVNQTVSTGHDLFFLTLPNQLATIVF